MGKGERRGGAWGLWQGEKGAFRAQRKAGGRKGGREWGDFRPLGYDMNKVSDMQMEAVGWNPPARAQF